jgi:hypothetical protein
MVYIVEQPHYALPSRIKRLQVRPVLNARSADTVLYTRGCKMGLIEVDWDCPLSCLYEGETKREQLRQNGKNYPGHGVNEPLYH